MKANKLSCKDLMVGDWVLVRPFPDSEPVKSKITAINYNSYRGKDYTDWVDTDFWDELSLDQVEPIPLTPEILEKNGFEYKEGKTGMFGVTTTSHYLCKGVPFEVFCDGEPFAIWFKEPVDIKFVHQLQHALRLCEIEKEIEL